MQTTAINIATTINNVNGIEAEDGQKIYELVNEAISNGQKVALSFLDMETLTNEFLDTAIGQLYRDNSNEFIKAHLEITNISVSGKIVLKRVVNIAKSYFTNSQTS